LRGASNFQPPITKSQAQYRFDCRKDRLWVHHHSAAPGVRVIIGDVVFIGRGRANIVQKNLDEPRVARAFQNTLVKDSGKHFGKERKDVKAHDWIIPGNQETRKTVGKQQSTCLLVYRCRLKVKWEATFANQNKRSIETQDSLLYNRNASFG
jgi:hypothetical protein